MLRDEGGLEYKAAIADTIIAVMEGNAEAKEAGLAHLCEFIEDCEHISLAVRILHLLGQEGPTSKQPSRYIRFIYNRVILESASVRAAAVTALARFAAACPPLLPNVLVLLSRCQLDSDDEVRDRAAYYCTILQQQNDPTMLPLVQPPALSVPTLERALRNYMQTPMEELFDISQVLLSDFLRISIVKKTRDIHHKIDNSYLMLFVPFLFRSVLLFTTHNDYRITDTSSSDDRGTSSGGSAYHYQATSFDQRGKLYGEIIANPTFGHNYPRYVAP